MNSLSREICVASTSIIQRALREPAFREALVANPRSVFQRECAIAIPGDLQLKTLQESPSIIYVVVPAKEDGPIEWGDDIPSRIIARAACDDTFRAALLANPCGTIERELMIDLPDDVKIVAVENTSTLQHVVVPAILDPRPTDVSDEAMEQIWARGICWGSNTGTVRGPECVTQVHTGSCCQK